MDFSLRRTPLMRLVFILLLILLPLASAEVDKKNIKRTSFESKLSPFQFFEDSETVLTVEPRHGIAHISKDAGASWDKVPDVQRAFAIVLSPNNNNVAIIMCTGDTHYITRNQGKDWTPFTTKGMTPSPASPFSFHGNDKHKIIINVHGNNERASYYTTDGFKTEPELLRHRAQQCMWAKEKVSFASGHEKVDKDRILCIAPKESGIIGLLNEHLLYSDNYFKDEEEAKIGDGRSGSGFVSMVSATKYVLAAKKGEHTTEMAMYTSTDGSEWHRALFGQQKIDADGYTVMESANYTIRVDVMEGGGGPFSPSSMGNLFGSDSNGTYFTSIQKHTNRNPFGFVDYERLDNVQGVALANIVTNPDAVLERSEPKQLQTHITFDDGRHYKPLKGQRDDRKGNLNLHGYSEMRNQGKVFSNRGAPGLLMGIGNLGDDLHDYEECNLWVSENGGEDWFFGYEGPHKYEFADSGSVLVAVSDTVPTDHIKYSLNYGHKWEKLKIVDDDDDKFRAGVFTTVTDSTSTKVLLTALSGRGDDAKLWVYSIDFDFLDLDKCKKDDLQMWHAREIDGEPGCVMGQQQSFRRKKPDAKCTVDKEFKEAEPEFKACPCTDADFECDTGYVLSESRKKCMPGKGLVAPKGKCKNSKDTFMGPSGFRQIPGNACKKNDVYDKIMADVERPCDDLSKSPTADGIRHKITPWEGASFREFRYLERPDFSDGADVDDEDETVLLLTEGNEGRAAWKTHDHGKKWKLLEDIEGPASIYPNAHEHRDAYIVTVSKAVHYTTDRGQNFRSFQAPSVPNDRGLPVIRFHEARRNWLIWTGCVSSSGRCYPTAHRSLKRGDDWEKLVDDAGTCEFVWQEGRNTSEKLVFCAREDGHAKSLVGSDDWFETDHVIFNDIANFATMSEFIIVATHESKEQATLTLNASIDAQTFAPARWPPSVAPSPHEGFDGYTVLDSSSHSIFLHITVSDRREREYGTIVKSNSNGTNFVTSLLYVNRNELGFVDFEKVQAIEGTALANVVANYQEVDGESAVKKLQTRITHNDGADWDYLTPPSKDNNGDDYPCVAQRKRKAECALHLHGYTERRSPEEMYSSPSAVGLVLGIGNVGSELGRKRDGDTFVSRDGGLTWHTAQKGQYMWEFGDQGSIIVLVEEHSPTNKLYYSLDEGRNFTAYRFTEQEDEEYEISDLSTVPSDGSLNFLLWGRKPGGRMDAVTINLDFKGAFDHKCSFKEGEHDEEDSDYELWVPEHPFQDSNCLFGHRAAYHRKKKTSTDCYNGPHIERFHATLENCSCTAMDFECDYNYERDRAGICKKRGEDRDPIEECRQNPGQMEYHPISGYRRIPGNTCQGGKELDYIYQPLPCPGHGKDFADKHGTSGWLVLFIVVICLGAAGVIGWFVYNRFAHGQFGRISLGDGDASGGQTTRLRLPTPSFDTGSALVRYPVVAVSAVAAGVMAVPMIAISAGRWVRDRFPSSRREGAYSRLGGDGPVWRGSGSRTYRSRDSFARGRDWTGQASDESDLLGEDSDEEA
ncbi:MAG: hypothetical protein Q9159_001823 [Coniocarpon cinnabarinum]